MRAKLCLSASIALVMLAACSDSSDTVTDAATDAKAPTSQTAVKATSTLVTGERIIANNDAEWITHGGDYAETRFSTLDQLNRDTIGDLGLTWSYDLGSDRGIEATPIVADGVMYVTSTFNIVHALDAVTGQKIWTYTPEIDKSQAANACCGVVNRGVAVWGDKVLLATIDGRLIALDRGNGEPVWDVVTVDQTKPYTITGAPRVVPSAAHDGLVIIGNGGAELGVRGYVSAYDVNTGEKVWRFYTVPGNPADGFEDATQAMAAETWTGDYWKAGGGGTAWDSMAYDPDLDLLYIGTGNGSPWNHELRSNGEGDNLFLSSIVALRPDTGEYVWHYQTTPGDTWDYTATQHMILADLHIDGAKTPVIMQAPKNGFFYVIDRRDGTFLSGDDFVPVNWATGIGEDGRPVEVAGARYAATNTPYIQLPGPLGAHNWQPMSYSPAEKGGTGLVYIPAQEAPWAYAAQEDYTFSAQEGRWNTGTEFSISALPDDAAAIKAVRASLKGRLLAWDPNAKEARWSVEHKGPWNGGLLSTAGGLVFQGTADANFSAFDAATGERVWNQFVQTGIVAAPVTYEVDGTQYVAVAAGWGGALANGYGGILATDLDHNTGRLLVYKAGGEASLPTIDLAAVQPTLPDRIEASADTLAHGRRLYSNNCSACHGDQVLSYAGMPNLRYSYTIADQEDWLAIVRDGGLAEAGMPAFDQSLTNDDLFAIRAFIADTANSERDPAFFQAIAREMDAGDDARTAAGGQ